MLGSNSSSIWHQKVADVLRVLVETSTSLHDPKLLCTLLQVSTACRTALQQARGSCRVAFDIRVYGGEAEAAVKRVAHQLTRLNLFACWLPKHAGLVTSLTVNTPTRDFDEVVASSMAAALQLCNSTTGAATHTGPPQLKLQYFETDAALTPALLRALAAVRVDHLQLWVMEEEATPAMAAALSSLTNVSRLQIGLESSAVPARLVDALQHLSCLTRLDLCSTPPSASSLPATLQHLHLYLAHAEAGEGPGDQEQPLSADLRHLTALRQLKLRTDEGPGESFLVQLPASVSHLIIRGHVRLQGVQEMRQLRDVEVDATCPRELVVCGDLYGLLRPWSLDLELPISYFVMDATEAGETVEALERAAAAVGSSHHLTRLALVGVDSDLTSELWCCKIAGLSELRELLVANFVFSPQALLHLTALSSLRLLSVEVDGVDDFTIISLVNAMADLDSLLLHRSSLETVAVLACVSRLTKLKELSLLQWKEDIVIRDHHLEPLLAMQAVCVLKLPTLEHCSPEGIAKLVNMQPNVRFVELF